MSIIAIDPGCKVSGEVIYNPIFDRITYAEHGVDNNDVLDMFCKNEIDQVVFEKPVGYSSANTVSETIFWTGRLFQKAASLFLDIDLITRSKIVGHYTNNKVKEFFPEIKDMKTADRKIKYIMERIAPKFELDHDVKFAKDSWQAFALLYYFLTEVDCKSTHYGKGIKSIVEVSI